MKTHTVSVTVWMAFNSSSGENPIVVMHKNTEGERLKLEV